jgi:hypothetical protein
MGEMRKASKIFVGKPEGKRPSYRWEYNVQMDFREVGLEGVDWIRLTQDRVQWRAFVNTVMNLRAP